MSKKQQRQIIVSMCNSLKEYMLARLANVPEEWDGHELRYWFAERADSEFR